MQGKLPFAEEPVVCDGVVNSRKSASKKSDEKYLNFF